LADVNQPRLISFSLDGWTGIGRKVTLTLTDGTAILVGRNGAGKSAILEGLESISSFAVTGRFRRAPQQNDYDSIPSILDISILTPDKRQLDYHYEFISTSVAIGSGDADESNADSSEEDMFSWNDRCQYADGQRELLWSTESGLTTLHHEGNTFPPLVLGSTTPFARIRLPLSKALIAGLPNEMEWVFDVLRGIRILGKAHGRQSVRRRPSLLSASRRRGYLGNISFGQADNLARKILRRMENGDLDELESVCQRIGVGQKITVQKFFPIKDDIPLREKEDEEYVYSVLLDGINIGLLSDGTLRVLSILIELLLESPSATTIIEEPEIQIHPGMLSRLLSEIEAYTFGGNLIISTHSPQVVSWTTPEKINLVYRNDGQTFIRKLGADEIQNVVDYLCEEGDLGDWLYSGILDDE
jgi:AAA domain, putative AbiEii toxin, Type IV TA system